MIQFKLTEDEINKMTMASIRNMTLDGVASIIRKSGSDSDELDRLVWELEAVLRDIEKSL